MATTTADLRIRAEGAFEVVERSLELCERATQALRSSQWVSNPAWWAIAETNAQDEEATAVIARLDGSSAELTRLRAARHLALLEVQRRAEELGLEIPPEHPLERAAQQLKHDLPLFDRPARERRLPVADPFNQTIASAALIVTLAIAPAAWTPRIGLSGRWSQSATKARRKTVDRCGKSRELRTLSHQEGLLGFVVRRPGPGLRDADSQRRAPPTRQRRIICVM